MWPAFPGRGPSQPERSRSAHAWLEAVGEQPVTLIDGGELNGRRHPQGGGRKPGHHARAVIPQLLRIRGALQGLRQRIKALHPATGGMEIGGTGHRRGDAADEAARHGR